MTDYIEITPEILYIDRAITQMRNAAENLHRAEQFTDARPPISKLLIVLANSIEHHGARNRGQVESALADYFDALERGEAK